MKAYSKALPDRCGSQINEDIFVQAHCVKNGLDYVGSYGQAHFSNHYKLSELLGLPLPCQKLPASYADYVEIKPEAYSRAVYPDPNLLLDQKFIESLRAKFFQKVSLPSTIGPQAAVHIRRGDVKRDNLMRYMPNSYYVETIKKIQQVFPNVVVSIFSESISSESFDEFRDLGCRLFLDADLQFTWKAMIFSDILVMSKGSFAYVPALYNNNFVIYYPAWYPKLSHWHHADTPELWNNLKLFLDRRYSLRSGPPSENLCG